MLALEDTIPLLTDNLLAGIDRAVAYGKTNLTSNTESLTLATNTIRDEYSKITEKLSQAESKVTQIQKDESDFIDKLIQDAKSSVTTALTTFLTNHFPADVQKIQSLNNIAWNPPTLTF
jgi:uncharacterized protein (DUF1800 family)